MIHLKHSPVRAEHAGMQQRRPQRLRCRWRCLQQLREALKVCFPCCGLVALTHSRACAACVALSRTAAGTCPAQPKQRQPLSTQHKLESYEMVHTARDRQ